MSLSLTLASTSRLNADVFRPHIDQPQVKPSPIPDPGPLAAKGESLIATLLRGGLDAVALNPQPLPPKEASGPSSAASRAFDDDWCGTVPRRIPHFPPPPPGPWSELASQATATR